MKTLHKLGLLGVFATACAFGPLNTQALSNTLPEAKNGVITLTESVEINWWKNTGKVTIDLNGQKLIRTGDGYLIDNNTKDAELTIIDSSADKSGSIVCEKEPSRTSSCIRNNGTLVIDGVKNFVSYYHGLKNEEDSTMTVKDSTIKATATIASGILNFGTLTVENSYIEGAKDPEGAAIFSLTWNDVKNNKVYSSTVDIKNSTLVAYWPVIIEQSDTSVALAENENVKVTINNSELIQDGGLVRIQGEKTRSVDEAFTLILKGNIKASSEALAFLEDGSKLTLNKDLTEEITVPVGMTLVVPEGIAVTEGKINFVEGAFVENRSGEEIVVYTMLDDEEKEIVVPNNTTISKVEEEAPVEPANPTEPENPEEPNEPTDDKPIENPQTLDGITTYVALAGLSVGALGLVLKKNLK